MHCALYNNNDIKVDMSSKKDYIRHIHSWRPNNSLLLIIIGSQEKNLKIKMIFPNPVIRKLPSIVFQNDGYKHKSTQKGLVHMAI